MRIAGIAVITGIALACFSPQPVDQFWLSWLPVILYIAYINPRLRLIMLSVGSFLWAMVFIHWQLDHRLSSSLNNKRLTVVGEVVNIPTTTDFSTRFELKIESIDASAGKRPDKIRLNWRKPPVELLAGQRWQLRVKLKRPHGFQNPGGFDYERWLFVKGIHATGYVLDSESNQLLTEQTLSITELRERISRYISEICQQCNFTGLIKALAIGFRGDMNPQHRRLLKHTGTAHLIAISGLHIGMIATVFYLFGSRLWNWLFYRFQVDRRLFAMMLAWIGGLGYSLLSGFDLPAQRAMMMLSVVLISQLLRVPFNLLNSVMLAMVLILLLSPLSILSESFWLTFSALLIIVFGQFLLQLTRSRLLQLFIVQLLFSILFIPVSILMFGQIHSASLIANLVAVPLVSFVIVPFNFLLLTLFWLPASWLQIFYGWLDSLLALLISYLQWLQDSGLQAFSLGQIETWKLILLALLLSLLLLPKGLVPNRGMLALFPSLLLLPPGDLDEGQLKMMVLDVGMGTSIVVQTRHHSLVYDFGPGNANGYSLGEWVVMPYLHEQRIHQPDRIILSHADQDHAGGLYALQHHFIDATIYAGTAEKIKGKFPALKNNVRDCHKVPAWQWDGVLFEFLGGRFDQAKSDNNRSCVLKISVGDQSILLAGDIEKKQEYRLLLLDKTRLAANILLAPHHGSQTSSSPEFVKTVGASHVIFTVGYQNRWRFPHSKVVERYARSGATLYRTDIQGAISIDCDRQHCQLQAFREKHPRLWY